jgi:hypothetical protein
VRCYVFFFFFFFFFSFSLFVPLILTDKVHGPCLHQDTNLSLMCVPFSVLGKLQDPCLPQDAEDAWDRSLKSSRSGQKLTLVGTGDYDRCTSLPPLPPPHALQPFYGRSGLSGEFMRR